MSPGHKLLTYELDQPKTKRGDERPGDLKYYKSQLDLSIVKDSLWVLAYCFKGSEGVPGITDFLKAYIHGGTVKNPKNPLRTVAEDIHLGNFLRVNSASHRVATMPRDYIFATMPQFPWYRYPGQAVQMSFGEIYTDLYMQAASAGHAFTCRFTRSMLDRAATDPVEAWQPSPHQPSPTCLGDFMKLIGHRVPEVSNGTVPHVHLTTFVEIKELGGYPNGSTVLTILEVSMKLFQQQWQESHRGGELSKFGNFPSPDWILHPIDAMRRGWRHLDPGWGLRVLESEGGTALYSGPGLDYAEDDLLQEIYSLDDTEAESRADPGDFVSLFEHTRRILDHMWCSKDPMTVDPSQRSDWAGFQHEMRARWTQPLLRTMLLFAAMITCRIPLSAAAWVDRMFVPVYVQYGDDLMVLGLLAKHARSEEGHRDQPRRMCSVGQHLPEMTSGVTHGTQFGRDHFLVEPTTHLPVGVLPDFLPDERTDQRYAQITSMLYAGLCQVDEENHVKILMAPLCVLQKGPAP